jgi:hypothetical protein
MSEARPLLEQPAAHNVGKSVRVSPRTQVTLLDLVGEDSAARSLHLTLTIRPVLAVEDLDADAITRGDDVLAAQAIVEVGSGGHRVTLHVDVLRGVAITLSASSIRVTAHNGGTAPAEIGAFVSYAETGAHEATLTQFGPTIAESDVWVLEAPAFASAVEVLADAALRVEVGFGRAGDRWRYAEEIDRARRMARPLPFANGCSLVRVTNRGPGSASPIAIFTLAL